MTERAAERAAVAGLPMADQAGGFHHQGAAPGDHIGELEVALARHAADLQRAVDLPDERQALHPIEIDHMVGLHEAHIEHRHEGLAAGQELGVLEAPEQRHHVGDRAGIVITEERRLHMDRSREDHARINRARQTLHIPKTVHQFKNKS